MANYVSGSNIIQPIHNIPPPPPTIVQSQSHPQSAGPPPAAQSIQPMNSMIQQRPDCRLASIVAPVSAQGSTGVTYPSCMVGSNTHTGHMEQPDPLNYEPYIWSF